MKEVDPRTVKSIVQIMMEMEPGPSMAPGLAGSNLARDSMSMTIVSPPVAPTMIGQHEEEGQEDGYTEDELRITKKYIEMIGGAERARELIDRVAECEDCLDIIDDEEAMSGMIGRMADTMPSSPDLPTQLYNPVGAPTQF